MNIKTVERVVKSSVFMTLLLVLMSLALARSQSIHMSQDQVQAYAKANPEVIAYMQGVNAMISIDEAQAQNLSNALARKQAEQLLADEQAFDTHWQTYRWAEHGCPMPKDKTASMVITDAAYCNKVPEVKTDEKRKARELAKKVFGLAEPK